MKIICINGKPLSGKSTFAEMCCKILGNNCINLSTVDFVKDIAKQCGWNGTKTLHNRKFLSDLKDLLTEWNDVPYYDIMKRISEHIKIYNNEKELIVFVHVREPKEIQKFVDRNNAITLLIRRPEVENMTQSNHADNEVFNYDYDYVIFNNMDLETLAWRAENFISSLQNE